MEIVLIGTGNTATVLGRMLKAAGHHILQVYGRNKDSTNTLAKEIDSESTNKEGEINRKAELYIIAVSDAAIGEVLHKLQLSKKTLVHTAGAVSKNILQSSSDQYGVLYPLQTLKKEIKTFPDVPLIIDASDEITFNRLFGLAETISSQVVRAGDEERLRLHLAAVFCNNFVNHLYVLSEKLCKEERLDFNLLVPLIRETASRIKHIVPSQAQTGPAKRNDFQTIEKHLDILNKYPELKQFYHLFTKSIQHIK
jgi:predicted short-subunit dehydrogenase-like oxidoreductase (DUF2520 family)